MSSIRDRVGRAIFTELFKAGVMVANVDPARAAIEAMRNPPDRYLGIHGLMDQDRARHIRADWERVIDAALRETE